jgi:hypothetical protein
MIFHTYKIYIFLKYLYFTNLVKKRPSKQLSKCSIVPLNNCNEFRPLSACGKEVRNREVISPSGPMWRLLGCLSLMGCGLRDRPTVLSWSLSPVAVLTSPAS